MSVDGTIVLPEIIFGDINKSGNNTIILSRIDQHLMAYTSNEWNRVEDKINLLSENNESMRRLRQFFVGGAAVFEIEKHRELVIPKEYIGYANLKQHIVILGFIDHFEIWSKEIHDKRRMYLYVVDSIHDRPDPIWTSGVI